MQKTNKQENLLMLGSPSSYGIMVILVFKTLFIKLYPTIFTLFAYSLLLDAYNNLITSDDYDVL